MGEISGWLEATVSVMSVCIFVLPLYLEILHLRSLLHTQTFWESLPPGEEEEALSLL